MFKYYLPEVILSLMAIMTVVLFVFTGVFIIAIISYRQLLEQFAAVSYCDRVFGQYILVPLQQRHSCKYKKILWSEMAAVLRLLSTPVDNVNIADYLWPCETDCDLLLTYLHALATGKVRDVWSPIMYKVAVHHVVTYSKTKDDKVALIIRDRINKIGNQELKTELEKYQSSL